MLTMTTTSEGSLASFDDEFDDLWTVAYRVAFRVLGVREDAEDVAQDAAACGRSVEAGQDLCETVHGARRTPTSR